MKTRFLSLLLAGLPVFLARAETAHLHAVLPYAFRITIADNASTDQTWEISCRLAAHLSNVQVVRLEQKGRGRALRQVWSASDATVLAYMDVTMKCVNCHKYVRSIRMAKLDR